MKKEEKIQRIIIIGIVCASVVIISLIAYLRNITNSKDESINDRPQELDSSYESASTQMGKSVEEAETDEFETAEEIEKTTKETTTNNEVKSKVNENKVANNTKSKVEETKENTESKEEEKKEETKEETEEPTFEAPVQGEIIKEFASDSLVYSETLKEWITHNGVDIAADKTSVVSSACDGKVYAIKNDPRYGLTVIINHSNGYQTIYSNLLTAEFVVEGEEVKKGQSIGTVGNSATFEISDDYHLHFEILKDNEYVDPTIYVEF